jgi:type IV pilus assembly protein PilQ
MNEARVTIALALALLAVWGGPLSTAAGMAPLSSPRDGAQELSSQSAGAAQDGSQERAVSGAAQPPAQSAPTPDPSVSATESLATVEPGRGRTFTGHPVTFNFEEADLKAVLRAFSEVTGLNVVIDPAIEGTVNVILVEVPWDQALDVILRQNKLGYVIEGTIVRIAPLSALADEEAQRRKLAEEQALAGDLHVLTKTLSYARAENMQALLTKSALSRRGSVEVDPRTNTLIITDLQDRLTTASQLIATLDRPQPQVEIEARIVQTSRTMRGRSASNGGSTVEWTPPWATRRVWRFPTAEPRREAWICRPMLRAARWASRSDRSTDPSTWTSR